MSERKRILIAGGGVAALEAALTLHELAPELVDVQLIAPEPRFWYRPMSVAEPFGLGKSLSFDLADLAEHAGALFTPGALVGVDAGRNVARMRDGAELEYDSLLLALGVEPHAAVEGALTFRGPADVSRVEDLLARIDAGEVRRVVVAVPLGAAWSLPAYELALMLNGRGGVEVAVVTPEDEPLFLFGGAARDAIRELLHDRGIALHSGFFATRFDDHELHLLPPKSLEADAVVALPALRGRRIHGIPQTRDGFVVVDDFGRVSGVPDVYAAGDITRFPVKQGGLATQQADAAAEAIAADAGARIEPRPFRPVLRGLLLTGREPRFLRRDVALGTVGAATTEPLWWPPAKLVGRRLAPLLAALTGGVHDAELEAPPGAVPIDVELALTEADAAHRRASGRGRRRRGRADRRRAHVGRVPRRRAGGHARRGRRADGRAGRRVGARGRLRPADRHPHVPRPRPGFCGPRPLERGTGAGVDDGRADRRTSRHVAARRRSD